MPLRVTVRLVTKISGVPLPLMSATSTPMLTPEFSISMHLDETLLVVPVDHDALGGDDDGFDFAVAVHVPQGDPVEHLVEGGAAPDLGRKLAAGGLVGREWRLPAFAPDPPLLEHFLGVHGWETGRSCAAPWGAQPRGPPPRATGARPNIFSLISAAIWLTRVTIPPASSLCSKKLRVGLAPLTSTILESTLMLLPRTVRLPNRR